MLVLAQRRQKYLQRKKKMTFGPKEYWELKHQKCYFELNFCLRGDEEHRSLKISQFRKEKDPDRYVHTEYYSKNRSGGLANMRIEHKIVPIYGEALLPGMESGLWNNYHV